MATLCIDVGNTLTKIAVFRHDEMTNFRIVDANSCDVVIKIIEEYGVDAAIMSTVSVVPDELIDVLNKLQTFIFLDHNTSLPIKNCYETKETLGKDRLACVVAANYLYPRSNVLVIDAGTAIKYDIITKDGHYLGGNISLGLQMRFKALHHFTDRLPLLDVSDNIPSFGRNTTEAIRVGVQQGMGLEIDGTIELYKQYYPDLKVIFTGGDAKFFDNKLKNIIFVVSNLIMIGLNRILAYNVKNL